MDLRDLRENLRDPRDTSRDADQFVFHTLRRCTQTHSLIHPKTITFICEICEKIREIRGTYLVMQISSFFTRYADVRRSIMVQPKIRTSIREICEKIRAICGKKTEY